MNRKPLNGKKTHPLSSHAIQALADLHQAPQPASRINAGVANRLLREDLAEEVNLASPFSTHKGRSISHLRITAAGQAALERAGR